MKVAGHEIPYNTAEGIYPLLLMSIGKRINAKKAVNIAITGEAGVGKSYFAIQLARKIDKDFDIDKQVVFDFKEFLEAVIDLKMGKPIVFDEPSYAISKHDWYKQINNALRKTIESFRFKVHPLIIPVINIELLDKTVRSYLLQYHVILTDRGRGTAYRLNASQFEAKNYRSAICNLEWKLYKQICTRESCLGCRDLKDCFEWPAVYERKKALVQEERYEDSLNEAYESERKRMTDEQIVEALTEYADLYTVGEEIKIPKLRAVLFEKEGCKIGKNKAYFIRELLMMREAMK